MIAGKAHPNDERGKHLIEQLYSHVRELAGQIDVVYLPGYDMSWRWPGLGSRHLAQYPATPLGGFRDQRHEGCLQRCPQP